MPDYVSLIQPTPDFYADEYKIFRHLYGIGAFVYSTGLMPERVQQTLVGFNDHIDQ